MPKKHKTSYTQNSNYVHPSLGTSRTTDSHRHPATVNERLQQLRLSNPSAELAQRQKDLAQDSSQRSVPPELGDILGVPEIAAPPPKPGARNRIRLRTPGPAPPPSWLPSNEQQTGNSMRFKKFWKKKAQPTYAHTEYSRDRAKWLADFTRRTGHFNISHHSLVHVALRTIARSWTGTDPNELAVLASIPEHLKFAFPSYIAFYASAGSFFTRYHLEALFNACDGVSCLDLTSFIGWGVTLPDVADLVSGRGRRHGKGLDGDHRGMILQAESWDDYREPAFENLSLSRALPYSVPLTALSLADPISSVSWTDLLNLTKHVPTLTHLSLRAWSWPAKKTDKVGALDMIYTQSVARGSDRTSNEIDYMLDEGRVILRKLSGYTYCLRTLDVTCCSWVQALVPPEDRIRPQPSSDWSMPATSAGPDWGGAWKLVSRVDLGHAMAPETGTASPGSFDDDTFAESISWESDAAGSASYPDGTEWGRQPARIRSCVREGVQNSLGWCPLVASDMSLMDRLLVERRVRTVGLRIVQAKREAGATPVHINYGWQEGD